MKIREIQETDNPQVKRVIQSVLEEMEVPKIGTAYADSSLDDMFSTYNLPRTKYFVVEDNGSILGGAGIAPLEKGDPKICELQKMYFMPQIRGKGVGSAMMTKCLEYAKTQGYQQVYLETMPYMNNARQLYKRSGFQELEGPLGDTGHYNCEKWMIKRIE